MNKLISKYFSELSKKSLEARRLKYGAEGFKEFMRKIGKEGGLQKGRNQINKNNKLNNN